MGGPAHNSTVGDAARRSVRVPLPAWRSVTLLVRALPAAGR